jgi:N utilization substance protein B
MRLAIFEFYFKKSISANIAISEAIRLAKKYSTPEAGAFINGVLDTALSKGNTE